MIIVHCIIIDNKGVDFNCEIRSKKLENLDKFKLLFFLSFIPDNRYMCPADISASR